MSGPSCTGDTESPQSSVLGPQEGRRIRRNALRLGLTMQNPFPIPPPDAVKILLIMKSNWMSRPLSETDPQIATALDDEARRQHEGLELIASENFVSEAVLEAGGSVFTNKYAEGYPGNRYYGGCEYGDVVEQTAIDRAKELFGADHANVQPHSGAQANMSVYLAAIQYGDTILGMNLSHGGHLTHGHPLNFSGFSYKVFDYGVSRETETIDYDELQRIAEEHKPKLLVCGASAYPRIIDFDRISEIAKSVGARMFADIAHISGPILAGLHPPPVPVVDYANSTTHKTLRGPRGGLILCKGEHAKEIDRRLFPGVQGGPLVHIIAAKAVAFGEALRDDFKEYQRQILANAKALCAELQEQGLRIVSGGTDNHLMLVDVWMGGNGITGKIAEKALEDANITVDKNTIPFGQNKPFGSSGLRIGTPAVTTRGMKEPEMREIGRMIAAIVNEPESEEVRTDVKP